MRHCNKSSHEYGNSGRWKSHFAQHTPQRFWSELLFTEFGPNVTTFVYPAEIFPVQVRTTAHGTSAAIGKVGAFIGAFVFPILLNNVHLSGAMGFAAIVFLAG